MKKIILKSLYHFLAFCSRVYLWRTKPIIIGVTGSVGKTTCRMIIAEVLKRASRPVSGIRNRPHETGLGIHIYSSPKNFNTELGLVFSVFCIEEYHPGIKNLFKIALKVFKEALFAKKKYDILVAEYGIDAPHDMDFLLKIAAPDITVLTKLGSVHSENFPGGVQELWQQKWLLVLAARQKIYFNSEDTFSREHTDLLSKPYIEIFKKEIPSELSLQEENFIQSWIYNKKKLSINLLGKEEKEYVNLGLMLADDVGIKLQKESYNFQVELLPGRFGVFQRDDNLYIDSTYNASPEAMTKLIKNTRVIHQEMYPDHKLIFVLGDMREIGEVKEQAHKDIAPLVIDSRAVMTVGPEMYQYLIPELKTLSYSGDTHSSLSARELGKYLKKYLTDHGSEKHLILFKGSQNTIFVEETLAELLTPTQQKNLIRQSESWKQKKEEFFRSL